MNTNSSMTLGRLTVENGSIIGFLLIMGGFFAELYEKCVVEIGGFSAFCEKPFQEYSSWLFIGGTILIILSVIFREKDK